VVCCEEPFSLGSSRLLQGGGQFLFVLSEKSEEVAQKPVDCLLEYLVEKIQMLDVKFHRNLLHHVRTHIFLLLPHLLLLDRLLPLLLLLPLPVLFLNLQNLVLNHSVQIHQQLLLEPLHEQPQSITNFDLGHLRREVNVLITLQQNHGYLVLSPLISRNKHWTSNGPFTVMVEQLYLLHQLRVVGKGRIGTWIELVKNKAAILVQTSIHLYLPPQLLQIDTLPVMTFL